jgi:hypothetical protein
MAKLNAWQTRVIMTCHVSRKVQTSRSERKDLTGMFGGVHPPENTYTASVGGPANEMLQLHAVRVNSMK